MRIAVIAILAFLLASPVQAHGTWPITNKLQTQVGDLESDVDTNEQNAIELQEQVDDLTQRILLLEENVRFLCRLAASESVLALTLGCL